MSEKDLVRQTANAFDFVTKLYHETAYLIKETEGLLQQDEEQFVICRPGGYQMTTNTSRGLEPVYVENWLPRSVLASFCPESVTRLHGGQTITDFSSGLKVIVLSIEFTGKDIPEPTVLAGCVWNIKSKKATIKKWENLLFEFSNYRRKVFSSLPDIDYEDSYCTFQGRFIRLPLFSVTDSEDVYELIVKPVIEIYRK